MANPPSLKILLMECAAANLISKEKKTLGTRSPYTVNLEIILTDITLLYGPEDPCLGFY
jgi:hypothetical protein